MLIPDNLQVDRHPDQVAVLAAHLDLVVHDRPMLLKLAKQLAVVRDVSAVTHHVRRHTQEFIH